MPTNRRRRRRERKTTFTSSCLLQQILGWSYFRGGYGDGTRAGGPGPDLERMEADWREHREVILDEHRQSWRHACLRPWAWWRFERGLDSRLWSFVNEAVALAELGEWNEGDAAELLHRIERGGPDPLSPGRLEDLEAAGIDVGEARRIVRARSLAERDEEGSCLDGN